VAIGITEGVVVAGDIVTTATKWITYLNAEDEEPTIEVQEEVKEPAPVYIY
jgi:hypothetical protein